jgi:hypothetical protein
MPDVPPSAAPHQIAIVTSSQADYDDTMKRLAAVILGALAIGIVPARGQVDDKGGAAGFSLPLDPSPFADSGKPHVFVLPPVTPPPSGCATAFDCRLRLLGAIQHDGAVELNATVFKW